MPISRKKQKGRGVGFSGQAKKYNFLNILLDSNKSVDDVRQSLPPDINELIDGYGYLHTIISDERIIDDENDLDFKKFKLLLDSGADINKQNIEGETPLHMVSIKIKLPIIKELIRRGANLEIRDNKGWTPLFSAAYLGYVDNAWELSRAGANGDITDNSGNLLYNMISAGVPRDIEDEEFWENLHEIESAVCAAGALHEDCNNVENEFNPENFLRLSTFNLTLDIPNQGLKTIPKNTVNSIDQEDIKDGDEIIAIKEENDSEYYYKVKTIQEWFNTRKQANQQLTNPNTGLPIKNQNQISRWTASIKKNSGGSRMGRKTRRQRGAVYQEYNVGTLSSIPKTTVINETTGERGPITNAISYDPIQNGDNMVNFNDEMSKGRYYKAGPWHEYVQGKITKRRPVTNPFNPDKIVEDAVKYKVKWTGGKSSKKKTRKSKNKRTRSSH